MIHDFIDHDIDVPSQGSVRHGQRATANQKRLTLPGLAAGLN
jgi:hypothetical protein